MWHQHDPEPEQRPAPAPSRERDRGAQPGPAAGAVGNAAVTQLLRGGRQVQRQPAAAEVVEEQSLRPGETRTGSTTTYAGPPGGRSVVVSDTAEHTAGVPTERQQGWRVEETDPIALAAAARTQLQSQVDADRRYAQQLGSELVGHDQRGDRAAATRTATELQALTDRIAAGQADLERLRQTAAPAEVRAIMERHGVELDDEATRTVAGHERQTTLAAEDGAVTRTTTDTATEEAAGGAVVERRRTTGIGTGGYTSGDRTQVTVTDADAGTRQVGTVEQTRQVGPSGYTSTRQVSGRTEDATGASRTDSRTTTTGVALGGGRVEGSAGRTTRTEQTTAGGVRTSEESTLRGTGALVHGESGSGVAAGGERSTTTRTASGVEVGTKQAADGSYTVNVTQTDTEPPKFHVTTTIHIGLAGSASGRRRPEGERGGGSASLAVSGQAGGDLVYTRTLSAAEATAYLGDLEQARSGRTRDGRPEYGLLARLRAARSIGDAEALAVLSADSAAAMSEGETVELDLSAGGDVSAGAGARSGGGSQSRASVGAEVSVGATLGRRIKVTRDGGQLLVTVTARREDRLSGSGTAGYGVASMTVGGGRTDGDSVAVTFRLDPAAGADYAARFAEVSALVTESGLVGYAQAHPDLVDSRDTEASRERRTTVGATVAGVGLTAGSTSSGSESVSVGEDRVTGTMSGGQTTSGELRVGDTRLARGSHASELTATVDANRDDQTEADLHVTVTETDTGTDLGRGAADLSRQFGTRRAEDNVADVLATGPSGVLQRLLDATSARITEHDLEQHDVDLLIGRAGQERMWGRAISRAQLIRPWERLRGALVDPNPRQEWLDADSTEDKRFAVRLAQAEALASFMEGHGEQGGREAVVWVLREWGAGGGFSLEMSTAADLGTLREWPPALDATKQRFRRFKREAEGLESRLEGLLAGADPLAAGRTVSDRIAAGLRQVQQEIEGCDEFAQPRAKLEMVQEVQRLRRLVDARQRRFEQMATQQVSLPRVTGEVAEADLAAAQPDRHAAAEEAAQASLPAEETADPAVQARLADMIEALRLAKREEASAFQRAREELPTSAGGTLSGFFAPFQEDSGEAVHILGRQGSVLEEWIRNVRRARELYRAAGVPVAQWQVKPDAAARPRALDPDINQLCRLYQAAHDRDSVRAAIGGTRITDQWRSWAAY